MAAKSLAASSLPTPPLPRPSWSPAPRRCCAASTSGVGVRRVEGSADSVPPASLRCVRACALGKGISGSLPSKSCLRAADASSRRWCFMVPPRGVLPSGRVPYHLSSETAEAGLPIAQLPTCCRLPASQYPAAAVSGQRWWRAGRLPGPPREASRPSPPQPQQPRERRPLEAYGAADGRALRAAA
jgi:hypothetical protein